MPVGKAPRRPLALLSLAGTMLVSASATTRGGTIPYNPPLASPDEVTFQTRASDYKIAGTHIVGAALSKSEENAAGYDRRHYGYGYGYGGRSRVRRTEILMIPQGGDTIGSAGCGESDA